MRSSTAGSSTTVSRPPGRVGSSRPASTAGGASGVSRAPRGADGDPGVRAAVGAQALPSGRTSANPPPLPLREATHTPCGLGYRPAYSRHSARTGHRHRWHGLEQDHQGSPERSSGCPCPDRPLAPTTRRPSPSQAKGDRPHLNPTRLQSGGISSQTRQQALRSMAPQRLGSVATYGCGQRFHRMRRRRPGLHSEARRKYRDRMLSRPPIEPQRPGLE